MNSNFWHTRGVLGQIWLSDDRAHSDSSEAAISVYLWSGFVQLSGVLVATMNVVEGMA